MNRKAALLVGIFIFCFSALGLQGVVPKEWELRTKEDFLKGKFEGISLSYEGVLSLSPREEEIEGPAEDFFLSFLITAKGTIFLGTGHGGRIYRIEPGKKAELYYTVPEMDISCLAVDKKGNIYAGTSPNGRIYRITARNKGTEFFNPDEKYIWDLLFVDNETLMAAVGETGGIYRINMDGEGRKLFQAEENHILCLKMDEEGNIFAGSGGEGLLYRITQEGKASVLFESPYYEIKGIAFDSEGNIFAAAGGKIPGAAKKKIPRPEPKELVETGVTITVTPESGSVARLFPAEKAQPGALYRVTREGMAKKVWSSGDELIYTLLWNSAENKLIFGTGNKGRIYTLDKNEKISLLLERESEQIYALYRDGRKIYVVSNNPSHLSLIYQEQRENGQYESMVLDTKTVSSWGRLSWDGDLPQGTSLQFMTRSGNSKEPGRTWSDWSPPYKKKEGEMILSPKARYLQFRAMFKTQSGRTSPRLSRVKLFYLQKNIAPLITKLEVLAPNLVFIRPPGREEAIWGEEKARERKTENIEQGRIYMTAKKVKRRGYRTIRWEASDENNDKLQYRIYIKGEQEVKWRLLSEEGSDRIFAFDTLSFPDGVYELKVVASDAPSNPPGTGLEAEKVSEPLIIDNSRPAVKNFKAVKAKNKLEISFDAEDSLSYIEEVKYLIRPNVWQTVFPEDGICDSHSEHFSFSIKLSPQTDNLLAIKVKDSHGNIGVYRHIF